MISEILYVLFSFCKIVLQINPQHVIGFFLSQFCFEVKQSDDGYSSVINGDATMIDAVGL